MRCHIFKDFLHDWQSFLVSAINNKHYAIDIRIKELPTISISSLNLHLFEIINIDLLIRWDRRLRMAFQYLARLRVLCLYMGLKSILLSIRRLKRCLLFYPYGFLKSDLKLLKHIFLVRYYNVWSKSSFHFHQDRKEALVWILFFILTYFKFKFI